MSDHTPHNTPREGGAMTQDYTLKIELFGPWRSGTGRGRGAHVDAEALRDSLGLPMLPGKQLKGLIRHALETGAALGGGWGFALADQLCGFGDASSLDARGREGVTREDDGQRNVSRFETTQGALAISSARLAPHLRAYFAALLSHEGTKTRAHREASALFYAQRQTKIDERGLVEPGTLRTIEVCVPLTLYAHVQGALSAEQRRDLEQSLKLIRAVGSNTTRGLGRAQLTLCDGAPDAVAARDAAQEGR